MSIFSLISVTFGAVTIFDQAFVKLIKSWQSEHVLVGSERVKSLEREECGSLA